MKKLSLNLDQLHVESFETDTGREASGTVRANGATDWLQTCEPVSCDYGCNTRNDGTCPSGLTCDTCDGPFCGPTAAYNATCPPECYD